MSIRFIETENVSPTLEEIISFMNGEKNEEDKNQMLKSAINIVEKNKIHVNCFKKGKI
jgi:hypothetical protein